MATTSSHRTRSTVYRNMLIVSPIREEKAGGGGRRAQKRRKECWYCTLWWFGRIICDWKGKEHGRRLAFLVLVSAPLSKEVNTVHPWHTLRFLESIIVVSYYLEHHVLVAHT